MSRGLGRTYWTAWTAGAVSFLGTGITFGALPLLAASLTRDPRMVSLTEAVSTLGWLLLGLVSGVMVDRWRRTSTMWIVDAFRAVIAGAFAAVVLADLQTAPLLLLAGFVLGLFAPFFDNASSAVVPDLVAPANLERANGYHQVSLLNALEPARTSTRGIPVRGRPRPADPGRRDLVRRGGGLDLEDP